MINLIDDFTLTADTNTLEDDFTTVDEFIIDDQNNYQWSILLKTAHLSAGELRNSVHLQTLDAISLLENNWDEGAIAPSAPVIQRTRALLKYMCAVGQDIYNIAPGPKGEILIDFRNREKSLELLFYPNKEKFVKFSSQEAPLQGIFNPDDLPELLTWLNK